jgi:2-keto-4-pentenoate hydratase/2-oxohepta-3-ene-1,7-dioic acid hydratase in catechol pathway
MTLQITRAFVDAAYSDLIFNVRQTIAFLSQGTTLEAGSLIMTGM